MPTDSNTPGNPMESANRERYRLILDMIPQIVWTATPDGTQDFANQRWYEFNGLKMGDPDPEPWRSIIHPEDVELTARTWAHSLKTGEPYSCLHRNRRHDGEYRWVLSRALPQRGADGQIVRWVGSGTDITEQKQAEEELIKYRDHLEELVKERTAQLTDAKERAEVANQAKSDFLAGMSHELRTPLNAILGYAQILKRADNLTKTQGQQLEILRTSGEHLLKLIDDVLDVGKIEARKMAVEAVPMDLPAMLQLVFHIIKIKADEKELDFRYEPLSPLPELVRGDERRLRQILLNLLSNALKYTDRGSVLFRVDYGRTAPGVLRCEIIDTGSGIPRDKLGAVFEPFTQLVPAGRQPDGTGLGLTITRQLVRLMGGRLGVASEVGKGSTFWIEIALPALSPAETVRDKAEQVVFGYRGDRRTILVVDDMPANADLLKSLFEQLGFRVVLAENGHAAVRQALAQRPDLAVIDLVMREMDGLAAVQEMRRHPQLAAMQIIGTSATVTDSPRKNAFVASCDDFVEKPIRADVILEKIRARLGLTWKTAQTGRSPFPVPAAADSGLEIPAREDMAVLFELARRGDMRKIQAWAAEMHRKDGRYGSFIARIRELADGFRVQAILELAEYHLTEGRR